MFRFFSKLNNYSALELLDRKVDCIKDEIDIPRNYFWNIPTLVYTKDVEGKPTELLKFDEKDSFYQKLILASLEEFNDLFNVVDIQQYLDGDYALSCIDMDKFIDSVGRDILYTAIDCLTSDSRYRQLMKDLLSVDTYSYCGKIRNIKTNIIKGCELVDRIIYMALDIYIANLENTFLNIFRFGNKILFVSTKNDFTSNLEKAINLADQFGMALDFDDFKVTVSCKKLTFSGFVLDYRTIVMHPNTVLRIKNRIKYLFRTYRCEEAVSKVYDYLFSSKTVNGQFKIENYFYNLTDSYQLNNLDLFIKDCILKSFSDSSFKLSNFIGLEELFNMYREDRYYMLSAVNRLTHVRKEGIITARLYSGGFDIKDDIDFYKAFVESIGNDDCYFIYNNICVKSCYMTFDLLTKTITFNGRILVRDGAVTVNLFYNNKGTIYRVAKTIKQIDIKYKMLGKLYTESAFNLTALEDSKPNPNRHMFKELSLNYILDKVNIPTQVVKTQQRYRLARFLIELFVSIVTNKYTLDVEFIDIDYKDIHLILEKPYFYKEVCDG